MSLTVTDPHGRPVDLIGSPFHIAGAGPPTPRTPPELGADTAAVLTELAGLGAEEIAELRDRGVV
jgi:crotonobetainyl-CoA:carnitine CoA-transferase CaiB-like acyl-CoA transferase